MTHGERKTQTSELMMMIHHWVDVGGWLWVRGIRRVSETTGKGRCGRNPPTFLVEWNDAKPASQPPSPFKANISTTSVHPHIWWFQLFYFRHLLTQSAYNISLYPHKTTTTTTSATSMPLVLFIIPKLGCCWLCYWNSEIRQFTCAAPPSQSNWSV